MSVSPILYYKNSLPESWTWLSGFWVSVFKRTNDTDDTGSRPNQAQAFTKLSLNFCFQLRGMPGF